MITLLSPSAQPSQPDTIRVEHDADSDPRTASLNQQNERPRLNPASVASTLPLYPPLQILSKSEISTVPPGVHS